MHGEMKKVLEKNMLWIIYALAMGVILAATFAIRGLA